VLQVLSASYRLASPSEGGYNFLPMSGTLRLALSLALIASGIGATPDSRSEDISDHRSQLMRIVERGLEDLSGTWFRLEGNRLQSREDANEACARSYGILII
jgi:hypothetical protein